MLAPARLLRLHACGSPLSEYRLRLGGYPALRSLSLQRARLRALPPVRGAACSALTAYGVVCAARSVLKEAGHTCWGRLAGTVICRSLHACKAASADTVAASKKIVLCCLFSLREAGYLAQQRGTEMSCRITGGCAKPAVLRAWEARSCMLRCHTPARVIRAPACSPAIMMTDAVRRGVCQELPFTLSHLSLAGNELTSLAGLALPALTWLDVSSNSIRARRVTHDCL